MKTETERDRERESEEKRRALRSKLIYLTNNKSFSRKECLHSGDRILPIPYNKHIQINRVIVSYVGHALAPFWRRLKLASPAV